MDVRYLSPQSDKPLSVEGDWLAELAHGERIDVITLGPRASLSVPAGLTGAILPLRGQVALLGPYLTATVEAPSVACPDSGAAFEVKPMPDAGGIVLLGSQASWSLLLGHDPDAKNSPGIFPGISTAPPRLAELMRALSQPNRNGADPAPGLLVQLIAQVLGEMQGRLDPYVARCPGRSLSARRKALLRLERIRNYMRCELGATQSIAQLARLARYSRTHFIRVFSSVYGETPYTFLLNHRIERSRPLVTDSNLSIDDIARVVGFDCRTAFYRAFKQRFGCSANDLRMRWRASSRAVEATLNESETATNATSNRTIGHSQGGLR